MMPGYDLHPGVDESGNFPDLVRQALVVSPEMQAALDEVYGDARARANHTGTQTASTISDFDTVVRATAASQTQKGTLEIATDAEVQTLTDGARAVTPAGLAATSVSAKTANRIVRRDGSGRARVELPSHLDDIANKNYVDNRGAASGFPAFWARKSGIYTKSGASSTVIFPWDLVYLNGGTCFSTSTYKFTAPVKGIYQFDLSFTSNLASSGGPEMRWYLNGTDQGIAAIAYSGTVAYVTVSASIRLIMDVNDTMDTRVSNNNASSISLDGTRSAFSGQLVTVVP